MVVWSVFDEVCWFPAGYPVPLPSGYVAVSASLGRGCPYLLPFSVAHFLNLSPDVCEICKGIRAAAWNVCYAFRTPIYYLVSGDLCVP